MKLIAAEEKTFTGMVARLVEQVELLQARVDALEAKVNGEKSAPS